MYNTPGKTVEVIIAPDGSVKIDAKGFNGMGCTEATAAIEKALSGGAGVQRSLKPEASIPAVNTPNYGTNRN